LTRFRLAHIERNRAWYDSLRPRRTPWPGLGTFLADFLAFIWLPFARFWPEHEEPDLIAFSSADIVWRWRGREYSSALPGSLELLERRLGRSMRVPWAY
jgi:hypothetical protein